MEISKQPSIQMNWNEFNGIFSEIIKKITIFVQ